MRDFILCLCIAFTSACTLVSPIASNYSKLGIQRVDKYITKLKNICYHRLPKYASNIGCKLQKTNKKQNLLIWLGVGALDCEMI